MRLTRFFGLAASVFAMTLLPDAASAANYPTPRDGAWVLKDFRFHSGESLPEVRLNYTTVGDPSGEPVLILHGTAGSAASMLQPPFADELFGPGQPLDARRYYVILPDGLGTGRSTRPSEGLRAAFPRYNYDDMVQAQYRLLTEGLGIRHLRLVLGYSMGGMHTWLWGQKYPDFMDALVPMAAQPVAMSGRNWMMRRLLIDAIRKDPDWKGGNYTTQPAAMRVANVFFGIATNGGSQGLYAMAPTRAQADRLLDERLAAPLNADANDFLYQWEASGDYDPAPGIERTRARLLAINSDDDERNPPELGVMETALQKIPGSRFLRIPGSPATRGHATVFQARLWKESVRELLETAPRRPY